MKEKLIEILKSYTIDKELVYEFFNNQNLNTNSLNEVRKKTTLYPCCDLDIIGVYPKINKDILVDYRVRAPKINNIYDSLIYIHETIHGLILETNLNMEFKDDEYEELLPMVYEDKFIEYLLVNKIYDVKNIYDEYIITKYNDKDSDERYIKARSVINSFSNNKVKVKKRYIK